MNENQDPQNQYTPEPQEDQSGTLKDVPFKIDDVFSFAFDQSNGFKGIFWIAVVFGALFYIPIVAIQAGIDYLSTGGVQTTDPSASQIASAIFGQLFVSFATAPIAAGFAMLALRRIREGKVEATEIFKYFSKILPLFFTTLLMYVLLTIGFALLIIPGIYLMVAYFFANFLVVDKGLGPWAALETSRKLVTKHWFTVFLCLLAAGVFNLIAMIPLGIGLIWSMPWTALMYAVVYLKLTEKME